MNINITYITCTRQEIEEATEQWWWIRWIDSWGCLGGLVVTVYNLERSLWA